MLDFDLRRDTGRTWLRLRGDLDNAEDADATREAFAFAAPDDHLILDLSEVTSIDNQVIDALVEQMLARTAIAECVVVSPNSDVSVRLVLRDVDRLAPIVSVLEEATGILDDRWASRRRRIRAV
jgi:anti-anti-sigma regulatory factor